MARRMEILRYRRSRKGELERMTLDNIMLELFTAMKDQNTGHSRAILINAVLEIECPTYSRATGYPVTRKVR